MNWLCPVSSPSCQSRCHIILRLQPTLTRVNQVTSATVPSVLNPNSPREIYYSTISLKSTSNFCHTMNALNLLQLPRPSIIWSLAHLTWNFMARAMSITRQDPRNNTLKLNTSSEDGLRAHITGCKDQYIVHLGKLLTRLRDGGAIPWL